MKHTLCMGICSVGEQLEVAAMDSGRATATMVFAASPMGLAAIRGFLSSYAAPVRLAVSGAAALSVALALGDAPQREVFIVAAAPAPQALTLAHYAERAI